MYSIVLFLQHGLCYKGRRSIPVTMAVGPKQTFVRSTFKFVVKATSGFYFPIE